MNLVSMFSGVSLEKISMSTHVFTCELIVTMLQSPMFPKDKIARNFIRGNSNMVQDYEMRLVDRHIMYF